MGESAEWRDSPVKNMTIHILRTHPVIITSTPEQMIKYAAELPIGLVPTTYKKGKIERLVSACVRESSWFTISRRSIRRVEQEAERQGKRFQLLEDPRNPSQIYCKYLGEVEQQPTEIIQPEQSTPEPQAPQNDPIWDAEAETLNEGV